VAEFLAVALASVMPRIGDEWTRRSSEYRRTTLAWAPPLAYGESHIPIPFASSGNQEDIR
jgi:hypothetical protein